MVVLLVALAVVASVLAMVHAEQKVGSQAFVKMVSVWDNNLNKILIATKRMMAISFG